MSHRTPSLGRHVQRAWVILRMSVLESPGNRNQTETVKKNMYRRLCSKFCMWRKVRWLTAAPLVGVTGCFANKDCRQQTESKVTKNKGYMWRDTQHLSHGIKKKDFPAIKIIKKKILKTRNQWHTCCFIRNTCSSSAFISLSWTSCEEEDSRAWISTLDRKANL